MSKLQEYRKKAGLKQSDLAKILKVSKTAIANYESGARIPPVTSLKEYAKAIDIEVVELIDLIVISQSQ